MAKIMDLTNERFGRLFVTGFAYTKNYRSYWNCICDCGKHCIKMGKYLRNGDTKSCGCLDEENKEKVKTMNLGKVTGNRQEQVDENTVKIYLSNSDQFVLCDKEDAEWLQYFTWHLTEQGYARTNVAGYAVLMHNLIMNFTPTKNCQVDHNNRNRLDNRKCNLYMRTNAENMQNKSLYKNNKTGHAGVYKNGKRWVSVIGYDGKQHHIGTYDTYEEAVAAREEEENKHFKLKFEVMNGEKAV